MKKFGLLGKKISYTRSPKLHEYIFEFLNILCKYEVYDLFQAKDEEIEIKNILEKLKTRELQGLNVTIPYKEKIIDYLDELDNVSKKIGAVNTVAYENGKLKGYNTDYRGVIETLNKMKLNLLGKNCYILGSGGGAKAVVEALKKYSCNIKLVTREKNKIFNFQEEIEILNYEEFDKIEKEYLLINTTPVELEESIEIKFEKIFDLKYNIKIENKKYENGLYMLVVQGIKSQEIWQERKIDCIELIYDKLIKEKY
ncbi:MAG: shikimate dehydrogenase family protein [Fusobacteriaceae bacterium]